jgi:alpha-galactosidase
LVDYAHSHGVKIGAYTDTGATNCCVDPMTKKPEPGSYGNEEIDVQTFADWGVDQVRTASLLPRYTSYV